MLAVRYAVTPDSEGNRGGTDGTGIQALPTHYCVDIAPISLDLFHGRRAAMSSTTLGIWGAIDSAPEFDEVTVGDERAHLGRFSEGSPIPVAWRPVKRALDVVLAGVLLVLALPILLIAAIAIAVDSRGGCLFRQTRLGAKGRPFLMLKLRTMRPGNDDREHREVMAALISGRSSPAAIYGKPVDDPRRTAVGSFLRRFSIDELPQLWNVLKGDMSLVGPRPPLPWEAELYGPRAWRRLDGKPGITGLWQVQGRGRIPFSQMVELDVQYWDRWSPWLELRILARTPKAALWTKNTA